jgi:hypothetical protein
MLNAFFLAAEPLPEKLSHEINSTVNRQERLFIVGVEDVQYYPLYDFNHRQPNSPSFSYELLNTFFRTYNYQVKFLPIPIKRFDKWFIEQNIDFKFPDNQRWQSSDSPKLDITYSEPVIWLTAGSFVLKKHQNKPREWVTSLGTIIGFSPTLWLDRLSTNQTAVLEEHAPMSIVRHLLRGNIDATNIDINVINACLEKLNKPGEIILAKNMPHERYAYSLSTIKYPEIIQQFNEFLRQHKDFIKKLKDKYQIIDSEEEI